MSSTYYLLCMSHDPATVITELGDPETLPTPDNIRESHPNCDLVVTRVSGAPVEFGCLGRDQGGSCRGHSGIEWVGAEWLRLLIVAQDARTEDIRKIRSQGSLRCWDFGRLYRLRYQLGTE